MTTSKKKIVSKSIWGPKGWHLLHSFSLHPNEPISDEQKHDYFLLYKTFYYIIPCKICKIHYQDMFDIHEPLQEKKITRRYLQKWVWKIHNRVNSRLGKKQIDFDKAMALQSAINNDWIFSFLHDSILTFDDKKCCIADFDYIYHFFYLFAKLYPDPSFQKILYSLVQSNEYSNIATPTQFKHWYLQNFQQWHSKL